jgi:hypothetical protein
VLCFDDALDENELAGLRKAISKETGGAGISECPTGAAINVRGFAAIFKLFITKHKFEVGLGELRRKGREWGKGGNRK